MVTFDWAISSCSFVTVSPSWDTCLSSEEPHPIRARDTANTTKKPFANFIEIPLLNDHIDVGLSLEMVLKSTRFFHVNLKGNWNRGRLRSRRVGVFSSA